LIERVSHRSWKRSIAPDREFSYETVVPPEEGVARRDPSNVVRVDGTYYVWYTKVTEDDDWYPHGYGGEIWYATSRDGHDWSERGRAISSGDDGSWEEYGVFTANVLVTGGSYYLFHSGVPSPFSNAYETATHTAIGIAESDSPDGPWEKLPVNPVLTPQDGEWDDFRIDDTCPIEYNGQYWFYYKGVSVAKKWRGQTPMCLATAEDPTGPYRRYGDNPLIWPGHEVTVWPTDGGVAALVNGVGLWSSPNGLDFEWRLKLTDTPSPPGVYRDPESGSVDWGICRAQNIQNTTEYYDRSNTVYLQRFDCDLSIP